MKIGAITNPSVAAWITTIFAVITNLWFRLSNDLNVRGLVSPSSSYEVALGWIGFVLQPWIWLGYACCRTLHIPRPHSSLVAALITSAVSGLLLFGAYRLCTRWVRRLAFPFVAVLALLSCLFAVSYFSELPRLIAYNRNPPVTGP